MVRHAYSGPFVVGDDRLFGRTVPHCMSGFWSWSEIPSAWRSTHITLNSSNRWSGLFTKLPRFYSLHAVWRLESHIYKISQKRKWGLKFCLSHREVSHNVPWNEARHLLDGASPTCQQNAFFFYFELSIEIQG
jgi:hypothetical protein